MVSPPCSLQGVSPPTTKPCTIHVIALQPADAGPMGAPHTPQPGTATHRPHRIKHDRPPPLCERWPVSLLAPRDRQRPTWRPMHLTPWPRIVASIMTAIRFFCSALCPHHGAGQRRWHFWPWPGTRNRPSTTDGRFRHSLPEAPGDQFAAPLGANRSGFRSQHPSTAYHRRPAPWRPPRHLRDSTSGWTLPCDEPRLPQLGSRVNTLSAPRPAG